MEILLSVIGMFVVFTVLGVIFQRQEKTKPVNYLGQKSFPEWEPEKELRM